eukprot:GHVS01089965.1.p1 GENE.GHVS01089965.1~~GHVS01089965.1.p1  ORF type:complete len:115 (-),score=15.51 GHVS01089965.1:706-1050(-)
MVFPWLLYQMELCLDLLCLDLLCLDLDVPIGDTEVHYVSFESPRIGRAVLYRLFRLYRYSCKAANRENDTGRNERLVGREHAAHPSTLLAGGGLVEVSWLVVGLVKYGSAVSVD